MLQAASLNWENCIVILLTIQSHENCYCDWMIILLIATATTKSNSQHSTADSRINCSAGAR